MRNKNGFTLIELLAIIVILAIIAVITVPIILSIIENSKKGAATDSALEYKDAVQKYFLSQNVDNVSQELPSGIKVVSTLPNDFMVSGDVPSSDSWLQLEKGQVVAYSLKFGDYVVTKYKDSDYVCGKGNVQDDPSLKVGNEFCYDTECFTLIKKYFDNGVEKAMLFAKYNLKKNTVDNTYKQDATTPDEVRFAGANFWNDSSYSMVDVDGNPASYRGNPYPYVFNSSNTLKPYVDGYVSDLISIYGLSSTISGRLLSFEEAKDIEMFADDDARANGKIYWLGTVTGSIDAKSVCADGSLNNPYFNYQNNYGIRPIIIIDMADLQ